MVQTSLCCALCSSAGSKEFAADRPTRNAPVYQRTQYTGRRQARQNGGSPWRDHDLAATAPPTSENELAGARYQGRVIAETANKLHDAAR